MRHKLYTSLTTGKSRKRYLKVRYFPTVSRSAFPFRVLCCRGPRLLLRDMENYLPVQMWQGAMQFEVHDPIRKEQRRVSLRGSGKSHRVLPWEGAVSFRRMPMWLLALL